MKNIKISVVTILISILFGSCTDSMTNSGQVDLTTQLIGIYSGSLKDLTTPEDNYPAEVLINKKSNTSIEMTLHCEIMDTSFVFDIFANQDSLMVCFSGEEFKHHYGHERSDMHHMMGDDEMYEWMHHLAEDHEQGDKHYGGFGMNEHSFAYEFYNINKNRIDFRFEGKKK